MLDNNASVLLLYTGGTIGMTENPETGALEPVNFDYLREYVPELKRLKFKIDSIQFEKPIDSSDMDPEGWKQIVRIIEDNYDAYDGFVVLHGTDTMAYSASALSFMLENLTKPVILTGSQLPIGKIRTDGKENLITALEIAVDKDPQGRAFVPEVCIFFQNILMRGNRTTKINADNFKAFNSFNHPILAEAGTYIRYRHDRILRPDWNQPTRFHYMLDPNVTILRLFPGISPDTLKAILSIPHLKGVVLRTYGAGNSPSGKWFLGLLAEAIQQGILIVNVTQCASGSVEMDRYQSGKILKDIGVISGYDITTEAAIAKLMFLLGHTSDIDEIKDKMKKSLVGESSVQ
ncbi:asparaginase [Bacteroidales bacterium OttesenSCG-928-J19]|nr:asparaginase [Bacteroidales bacterium OttesenSCG-928-J19]